MSQAPEILRRFHHSSPPEGYAAVSYTHLQWEDAIELLVRTANACGHPYQHPLTGISITEYS